MFENPRRGWQARKSYSFGKRYEKGIADLVAEVDVFTHMRNKGLRAWPEYILW